MERIMNFFKTFKGGTHPPSNKHLTKDLIIDKDFIPSKVIIPLIQHIGVPCQPLVKVGDKVSVGDKIAESDKFISAPIHTSISGTVKTIDMQPHPVLGKAMAITIEPEEIIKNKKNQSLFSTQLEQDINKLSTELLKTKIKDGGLVGLGGAAFPTHVKLSPPENVDIDTLIINGAECEPYLTADYRLMLENPLEIIKGIELLAKILNVKNIFIGIEENKPKAIQILENTLLENNFFNIKIVTLKAKYPQGGEKQLISAITKRKVPAGKLPLDIGVCVNNIGTCFAAYEIIYKNKPLIERVLTVSGDIIKNPKNILVPIGSLFSEIIDYCGGFTTQPAKKIIMGGPMMGISQHTLELPVIKGTSGIILEKQDKSDSDKDYPCINCGRCVNTCPMGLSPGRICALIEQEQYIDLKQEGILDCMECGACTYACPAKKAIVQKIKLAKLKLKK
jgi:Na+-translocating ferredoxin:NAD+ oxidoreductase subunit C